MANTTLVIMAAGIGSRYGAGIKQLADIDSHDHIIIDYSIHDAIEAGFNKIVFIIRRDIEEDFKEAIGNRIEKICADAGVEVAYAFQDITDIPAIPNVTVDRHGYIKVPGGRTKPWGTGHAVLSARNIINEPYAVINADDYYGKKAFKLIHAFLEEEHPENVFCMVGYILENTLSENGKVTRGICTVDDNMNLVDIIETRNIEKTPSGVEANGLELDAECIVSMNMWGMSAGSIGILNDGFFRFMKRNAQRDPLTAEYLIPVEIGRLLEEGRVSVEVLKSDDKWYGITYAGDVEPVKAGFKALITSGVYEEDLYSDL